MIIVVTDGYALNPGDLSWAGVSKFGELQYYDRSLPNEVPSRCAQADIIITNKTPISAETISGAKNLKLITSLYFMVSAILITGVVGGKV